MPLLLTRKDVESVLTMKEAIAAVEEGFRQLALGSVTLPQRTAIRLPAQKGLHLTMPAAIAPAAPATSDGASQKGATGATGVTGAALAVKVVTVYPDNPARYQLPTIIGTLILNDPATGALLAVMDAGFLTAMRTGAASGVATRLLARPEAETVGIFGAGVQARTQLAAMCEVRRIKHAVVCDPVKEARDRFAAEMGERYSLRIEATDQPSACLATDIIVTASSSPTPVFEGKGLRPGTHINGVGSHSPDARELDSETIRRCRVISDLSSARLAEDGDFIVPLREGVISEEHVQLNLGDIIVGRMPGRQSLEEITLFKSGGLAVQDAATGVRVYELARARGVGQEVEI